MAYPISNDVLQLFLSQYRQIVRITVAGQNETFEITENDIIQNGFGVSRYSVSGSALELGSAISSEVDIVLNNKDGRFNATSFEGAELYIEVGIKKWDAHRWEKAVVHYVPMGYFTIDNSPRKSQTISLAALDRMMQFAKTVVRDKLVFPTTVGTLLRAICGECGITLATDISTLPNINQNIPECPDDEDLTYRTLLQWIAQMTGTCAYIDWEGKLRLEWYKTSNPLRLTPSTRYTPADLAESDITITGVELITDDDKTYLCGEETYTLVIEGNKLIQTNHEEILRNIYLSVGNFTYRTFSCNTKPFPHLFPMDMIEWEDAEGNVINTALTNYSFSLNGSTALEAKGDTETNVSYASSDPLTAQEKTVINKLKTEVSRDITVRQQAVLDLNETIANALGLYETRMELNDKSIVCYYHDKPTLAKSTVIYTRNAGGYAWTTGENCWNDGNPTWQYGYTKEGNAVYNALSAYKIQTELLDAECVTAEKISVEYKDSVTDDIEDAKTDVTQAFTVADGMLDSRITSEVSRAKSAESTLSSRITQTSDNITAEVTRATVAEGDLLGKINVTSDAITSEVSRAKSAESTLSSRIDLQASKISLVVEEVNGVNTIATASIVAAINDGESNVKISADHIELTGEVTVIASKSDIPTRTSQLTNNSGFTTIYDVNAYLGSSSSTTYKKVVSIIDGTVTADYIEAIGITANALVVKDSSGNVLLGAGDNKVDIAGFSVSGNSFTNVDSNGYGVRITNESLSVSKLLDINSSTNAPMAVELSGVDGLLTISTYPIPGNDYYTYVPLLKFVSSYSDPFGDGYYIAEYRYLCVRKYNTSNNWTLCITKSLDFPNGAGNSITTL